MESDEWNVTSGLIPVLSDDILNLNYSPLPEMYYHHDFKKNESTAEKMINAASCVA